MKKKTKILAVDDEPLIGEAIASALEAPHRKIAIAANGEQALSLVGKTPFDLIITDHRMPKSGGLDLVRKLRQRKYRGKIVVLSAHLSPQNIGTYEDLDIDEVLSKPFDLDELCDIVDWLEEDV